MMPKNKPRSALEILVSPARRIVCAAALVLIPAPISSSQHHKVPNPVYAEEKHELGRAHQLLIDFPEPYEINGAKYVNKFFNPEANYLTIIVRRLHADNNKKMSRTYIKQLIKVNGNAYYIHLSLKKHFGLEGVHTEAVTPETLEDYLALIEDYQFTKEILDECEGLYREKPCRFGKTIVAYLREQYKEIQKELAYDAVKRLVFEEKIEVLPAETLEKNLRAEELCKKWRAGTAAYEEAMNAIYRDRELESLDFASRQRNPVTAFDYGADHTTGGYVDITKCSFIKTATEWNSKPENRYRQVCVAIITPWGVDD